MMQIYQFILLSFIQAVTEFLPISSSGHLLFFKGIMDVVQIPLIFDVMVHAGSLVAIVFFYRKRILITCQSAINEIPKNCQKSNVKFLGYVILSTTITFLFYVLFKDFVESKFESPGTLTVTYLVTTIILLLTRIRTNHNTEEIIKKRWYVPFFAGLVQGLAILPGISRSGSTISSLLIMDVKKEEAAYYSFFLAIPAIGGALIFQLLELENIQFLIDYRFEMTLSFLTSAVFSYLFLSFLVWIIRKGKLWIFAFYTFSMAVFSWILF